jgi:hypothetical protein
MKNTRDLGMCLLPQTPHTNEVLVAYCTQFLKFERVPNAENTNSSFNVVVVQKLLTVLKF